MNAITDQYAHTSVCPFWAQNMMAVHPLFSTASMSQTLAARVDTVTTPSVATRTTTPLRSWMIHGDEWYLGIYADAIQWVQITNTRGMSQWADGGIVATKPYVSAAAYIHKMSNYCDSCKYDKKKRVGENACPFNSLYWNFLDDKKEFFSKNNRMAMMLRLLEKIPPEDLEQIKLRAAKILKKPDEF